MQHLRQFFILIIKSKDGMKACQIVSNLLCMLKHLSGVWDINPMHINIGNKTKLLLLRLIVCSDIFFCILTLFIVVSKCISIGLKLLMRRFKLKLEKSGRLNKTFFKILVKEEVRKGLLSLRYEVSTIVVLTFGIKKYLSTHFDVTGNW